MAVYLDHIGVAVGKDSRLRELLEVLGLKKSGEELVAREEVLTEWIPLPAVMGHVELLHSTRPEATIGKFLHKMGRDAVHHLSFRVDDIESISQQLISRGFGLVYAEAKLGAHDCLVNFVHPSTSGGVLVEITQKKP